MLSGEVGYFKGAMQLTHPDFLVLDSPQGRMVGSKSLKTIAGTADTGELDMSAFERDFFPIYPASAKLQSWDIYACVRQVLAVLDPIADPLPEDIVRQRNLVSEDTALRAVHIAEREEERERGHWWREGTGLSPIPALLHRRIPAACSMRCAQRCRSS
jgi:ATP-dependent DNA helicase RecG